MKQEYIEAFLEIVKTGNVTKAANNLHLAQSTVSHYIKMMEEEIGMPLIYRSRGVRNVQLTSYGEQFIPLAENWINLLMRTEELKHFEHLELNLACMDSLVDSILYPVLYDMQQDPMRIHISLHTASSDLIYHMAETHAIDFGLVGYEAYRPGVKTQLLFREKMCVVKNMQILDVSEEQLLLSDQIVRTPQNLPEAREIRLRWGREIQDWHTAHWDESARPLVETDSMILLRRVLQRPTAWAAIPEIELQYFDHPNVQICELGESAPPERRIYQITPQYMHSNHQKALYIFLQYLDYYLQEQESLIPE